MLITASDPRSMKFIFYSDITSLVENFFIDFNFLHNSKSLSFTGKNLDAICSTSKKFAASKNSDERDARCRLKDERDERCRHSTHDQAQEILLKNCKNRPKKLGFDALN